MNPGDPVPDFEFRTPDDQPARLSSFATADHLLIVFVRHLV